MTRGRNHDSLEAMQKRRDSWAREIGTDSQYAEIAPTVVAELDAAIDLARLRISADAADRGEGVSLAGKSREERRRLLGNPS